MKKLFISLAITASLGLGFLAAPEVRAGATCNGVPTSVDFGCKTVGTGVQATPVFSLLLAVVNFMAIGVGVVVVGGIVWGSFLYVTSNGNSSKTEQAVTIIANSVVGLALYAFLFAIVNFLVPGGLFT